MDHLHNASPSNDPQAEMVSGQYHAEIADLVVCVREIYSQWERHIDDRVMEDVASQERIRGRGERACNFRQERILGPY